jgi:hypothetical protein
MEQFIFWKSLRALLHSCAEQLFQLMDRYSQARVLVVGDLTLDEFITGQVKEFLGKHQC